MMIHASGFLLIKVTADKVPRRFKTSINIVNAGEAIVRISQITRALEEAPRGRRTISGT